MSRAVLHCGDVRAVLASLPERSVQCCVTSPPYFGLRDYGQPGQLGLERTPEEYVAAMVGVFHAVRRVLRDDGVLWLNLGDSYCADVRKGRVHMGEGKNSAHNVWHDRKPEGMKHKDLVGIPWLTAFALRADGWYLRSDVIWCLSGGTRIYAKTQKGEMPMTIKDMVRLRPETVQLWNGERWTQVLGWNESPRPENPVELVLRSGERITCTPAHQWPTSRGRIRAEEIVVGDVLDATTLPAPLCPREPKAMDSRLVGLFAGLYLAEGSRSGDTIQIAGHKNEDARLALLKDVASAFGGTCARHETTANGCTINLNGRMVNALVDTYIGGRTARDKHLTPACWQRGNRFLQATLEGYLAGDGHYDAANDRWRIGFTRNYALEADLRTLCARLDARLRLKPVLATMDGRQFPAFRGEIRFDYTGRTSSTEVMEIRRGRARKFWDIGVADEPHTFALASGVLTHNSKPNPMPESVTDRPTKSHEYLFLLTKGPTYYYDATAIAEPPAESTVRIHSSPGVQAKAGDWKVEQVGNGHGGLQNGIVRPTRNARSVWTIATQPYPMAHFATFPEELARRCILAGASAKACESCGAPWERVTEREENIARTFPGQGFGVDERKALRIGGSAGYANAATVGWQPTCACCMLCDSIAHHPARIYAPQGRRTGEGVAAGLESKEMEGERRTPSQVEGSAGQVPQGLRTMSDGVSREKSDQSVLLSSLFDQVDVGERQGNPLPGASDAGAAEDWPLLGGVSTDSPDGDGQWDGVRPPSSDGGAPGQDAATDRRSASPKWRSTGQSDREPTTDREAQPCPHSLEAGSPHVLTPYPTRPGVVLDPFGGSGTTAAVAVGHGRNAIYVDLNPEYLHLARQRIGPMLCDDVPRFTEGRAG